MKLIVCYLQSVRKELGDTKLQIQLKISEFMPKLPPPPPPPPSPPPPPPPKPSPSSTYKPKKRRKSKWRSSDDDETYSPRPKKKRGRGRPPKYYKPRIKIKKERVSSASEEEKKDGEEILDKKPIFNLHRLVDVDDEDESYIPVAHPSQPIEESDDEDPLTPAPATGENKRKTESNDCIEDEDEDGNVKKKLIKLEVMKKVVYKYYFIFFS